MAKFDDYCNRQRDRYGSQFDPSNLDPRFVPFYESEQRIKVQSCDMTVTGTVGATTGWRPCFLLMRTARSIGSMWTLDPSYQIIAVKRGRTYVPYTRPERTA